MTMSFEPEPGSRSGQIGSSSGYCRIWIRQNRIQIRISLDLDPAKPNPDPYKPDPDPVQALLLTRADSWGMELREHATVLVLAILTMSVYPDI